MKQALRQFLGDLLSAILFLLVYVLSANLFAAAGIAVAVGVAQLARLQLKRGRIEPMQCMSLGLAVVLGGATMLTRSLRFMMLKPSIIHFAVAGVMLRRGWMSVGAKLAAFALQYGVFRLIIRQRTRKWEGDAPGNQRKLRSFGARCYGCPETSPGGRST